MDRIVKHFNDIWFSVVAEPHEYHVSYTIYDQVCQGEDGMPEFPRAGSDHSPDPVPTIEESEPYLHGDVKWDGCSNWYFDEQDRVMLHGCTRNGIARFGEVMARCWDWTSELCPHWYDAP